MSRFSLWTTAELRAAGESFASIRASIERGERFRVIGGWYGTGGTPPEAVLAMRMGGRLGCVSALELYGVWCPPRSGTHVVFPAHASGRRSADRPSAGSVIRHWHGKGRPLAPAVAVMPLEAAIIDAVECLPPYLAIGVLDSVLHKRLMSRNRLEALLLRASVRAQQLAPHLEPRSESGLESIVRYRLSVAGIGTHVQVTLRTSDRLDLEVDGWLALEIDGRRFHAQAASFTKDRVRIGRVMREGRIVLQFAGATVIHDWELLEATVREVIDQHAPVATRVVRPIRTAGSTPAGREHGSRT